MSIIYHYTTQTGVTGVLSREYGKADNKIKLWFTRADFLNDSSEGTDIERIYNTVIKEMKDEASLSNKQYQRLGMLNFSAPITFFSVTDNEIHTIKSHTVESDVYICSFSNAMDELDLWRYYSKGNIGYCLEFLKYSLESNMNHDPFNDSNFPMCKVKWLDVIYDDKEKKKYIRELILHNLSIFNGEDETSLYNLLKSTEYELNLQKYAFKHPCFASEEEVRCIITVPKETIKGVSNPPVTIKERVGYGEIIPYIEWEYDISALRSIMVSPMAPEGAVTAAQQYVDKFMDGAYGGVIVEKSKLPVKF